MRSRSMFSPSLKERKPHFHRVEHRRRQPGRRLRDGDGGQQRVPRDALRSYLRGIALIAEKDMRIYYTKPPVLMFRLPVSAFYVPRVLR